MTSPGRVSILGGTGPAGKGLALRLASSGWEVFVGSRSAERADEVVGELLARWGDRELNIAGAANADAVAAGGICVVATPWDAATSTASELSALLTGRTVVSMANALARVGNEFQALVPARGSIAAALQCALPGAHVSGAFHHLPARELGAIDHPIEADVLVCADDEGAMAETIALVESVQGLRGVDAGSLSACGAIEAFTAVLLGVNVRHKTHASIRLTGLEHVGGAR
ncbi:MAG TPA: NADPH-dependent F420 reductase [Acidimicrobiales bacterium]|nr:NADPH-dependent F420 reductase [Acidimicrobiales bacterium]